MGAFNSIHTKLSEFSDTEDDKEPEYSTPQKTSFRHKVLLDIDPRSPTENINRTPIVVEGTPSVQSSKAMKARIPPTNCNDPMDPRSPSVEFTRTPISLGQSSVGISDTPVRGFSNMKLEDAPPKSNRQQIDTTEEKLNYISDQSISSESVTVTDGSPDESVDTAPLLDGTDSTSLLSHQLSKKSNSFDTDLETDEFFSSQNKLKCRQINRILGNRQQSSVTPKGRSPLRHVENSPQVSLVQKKSMPTADKSDSKIIYSSVDKENVCH